MLSPKYNKAIIELAEAFYNFLPASGNPQWKGHTTFASIADECGVGRFWQGGSKSPAIANLLAQTYEHAYSYFERLIISIVNHGMLYKKKNNAPVTREEIECINSILLHLGIKVSQLREKEFLENLPSNNMISSTTPSVYNNTIKLDKLKERFYEIHRENNRQQAGLSFEVLLHDLFCHFDLEPKTPFSVTGEQIDGSFELDHEIYLIEAKWYAKPMQENELLVFRGKIEGKSSITRGVFIAVNGYTENAIKGLCTGKQPNFFLVDGADINDLFCYNQNLIEMLRFKRRSMAEGNILARFK